MACMRACVLEGRSLSSTASQHTSQQTSRTSRQTSCTSRQTFRIRAPSAGAIHETGHALYEQGRNLEYDGLPVNSVGGSVVSLCGVLSVSLSVPFTCLQACCVAFSAVQRPCGMLPCDACLHGMHVSCVVRLLCLLPHQRLPAASASEPYVPTPTMHLPHLHCSQALGMGVHESQSLLWERMVGLSRPFAAYLLPLMREHFPEASLNAWDLAVS